MADRTIIVDVQSNLREQTQDARQLNKELDKVGTQRSATRTGSRAADAALGVSEAGLTRGTTGAGGRGGERDFARQAQGLGGLVHIYATFAANIYAVTAAFNALSKAADVSNMEKAARDLSAVYGVSLSNISKQLVVITDGALAASDALQFSAMGASAGLNTKQMQQLTTVAKGASLALGRDLADSMQRIYKGAIKVEPELLDELGIMVKLDQATAEYARTIGKTTSSLTDYERRQAYVNAVIKEGSDKFAELADKSTNPYSKLLASTRNVLTSTGSFINDKLEPLIAGLASSPTGIALALSSVAGILLKQAIPGITTYIDKQKELSSVSAKVAKDAAKNTADIAKSSNKQFEQVNAAVESVKVYEQFSDKSKKSKALQAAIAAGGELSNAVISGFDKPPVKGGITVDSALKSSIDNYVKNANLAIEDAYKKLHLTPNISEKNAADQKKIIEYYTKQLEAVKALPTEAAKLNVLAKEQLALEKANLDTAIKARQVKTQDTALKAYQKGGIGSAMGVMWSGTAKAMELQTTMAGKLSTAFSGIGSSMLTLGKISISALPGLINWVSKWGMIATVLVTAGKELLTYAGFLSDASQKAQDSAAVASESLKTVSDSIDKLSKAKDVNSMFKLETATLTGLVEAQKNIDQMSIDYDKFAKGPALNKIIDRLMVEGTTATQAKAYGTNLDQLVAANVMSQEEATTLVKKATGANYLYQGSLADNLSMILSNTQSVEEAAKIFKVLKEGTAGATKELDKQVLANKNIEAGLQELNKISADYVLSLTPSTPISKGASNIGAATSGLLSNPTATNTSNIVAGLTKDTGIMAGVPIPADLVELKTQLNNFTEGLKTAVKENKITQEESTKNLKIYTDNTFGPNSSAFKSLVSYSLTVSDKFQYMAKIASDTAVALASIGQKLRTSKFVEGITGTTTGLLKEQLSYEKQQRAIESTALNQTKAQLTALISGLDEDLTSTLKGIGLGGGTARQGITSLLGKETLTDKEQRALSSLVAMQGQQTQQRMALYDVEAKLKVISMSSNTAAVEAAMVSNQANKDTLEGKKAIIASENTLLDIKARDLELYTKLHPYMADELAITKEEISAKRKQNDLLILEAELRSEVARAAEAYNLPNATKAEKDAAAIALSRLGIRIQSNLLQQEDLKNSTELTVKDLERLKVQNELIKRTDLLTNMSQVLTLANDSIYQSSGQQLANLEKIALINERIDVLKREELNNKLLDLDLTTKAGMLEAERLQTQIDLLDIQKNLRKEKEAEQTRSASMKSFEESGNGDLATYGANMWDYANAKWANERKQAKSIGETFVDSMSSGIDTISAGLSEMLQKNELSWKSLGDLVRNTFSDIFRDLSSEFMKLAIRMAMFGNQPAGGGGGFGGLFGAAISIGSAFMGGGGSTLTGNEAGIINNAVSQAEWANTFAPQYLAKGGVMTEYGPLKLNKYANGGIANSPQVAIYGEGSQNEAYVPLPDNRTIPVTLTGNQGSRVQMGDTNININIASNGEADTTVAANTSAEFGKRLAEQVKAVVQKELMDQTRPFGLLARR